MGDGGGPAGTARLHLADGLALLRPEEQVFTAMLDGWRAQQLARNLAFSTVDGRAKAVEAFACHAGGFPWQWSPGAVDEWFADLRAVRHLKRSTLRSYQEALRGFCSYVTDPAYDWPAACEQRFGTHPVQVVHEWNTAVHVQEQGEGDPARRAFTRAELEALFDHADEQVTRVRASGRKGWLPAFRDATLFKVAYAYGLRRREVRMLDVADFGRNPHGAEFGEYGVCYVRYGKAKKGSPPKQRSVLTVWDWVPEILEQWITEVRPAYTALVGGDTGALWPSERAERIALSAINTRLARYRDELGLDPALEFHSLRRSYVTHLIEDGWDPLFVQQQAGQGCGRNTRQSCRGRAWTARRGREGPAGRS